MKEVKFESSVILWGSKTSNNLIFSTSPFESSVILWGSKTPQEAGTPQQMFESSVILWGSKTVPLARLCCLDVWE